jgi:hypothetical protein
MAKPPRPPLSHDLGETSPQFVVNHDAERHQWQVIDRQGSKGQYPAVIAELDDAYPTSRNAIERYCRQLNAELGGKATGG